MQQTLTVGNSVAAVNENVVHRGSNRRPKRLRLPARLVEGKKTRKLASVSPEQMAKMEREMSNLQGQYKLVEQTYGQDVLN